MCELLHTSLVVQEYFVGDMNKWLSKKCRSLSKKAKSFDRFRSRVLKVQIAASLFFGQLHRLSKKRHSRKLRDLVQKLFVESGCRMSQRRDDFCS